MKLFITLCAVILTLNLSANTNNGDYKGIEGSYLLENAKVDVFVKNADVLDFFSEVKFDESKDRVKFKSFTTIESIQVVDKDGEVELSVPIDGTSLNLSIKEFVEGSYTLNIKFSGDENVYKTGFQKKY